MGKILLCGNGININFEEKFSLAGFIDLLLDEKKLREFFFNSTNFFTPSTFTITSFTTVPSTFNLADYHKKLDNFCWTIKKCREKVIFSKENFLKDGVENVFKQLFQEVEDYLAFDENNELSYEEFESTFKEIFFTYIWQLQNQNLLQFITKFNTSYPGLKVKLENYMKIITLNYDSILEKIIPKSSRDIIHWHGMIKVKQDGSLNYTKCLLDTIRKPKSLQTFKQIPLFKQYQEYKNKYELDIIGLNPMNDENVFALFINSQICNKINFYYHSDDDLKNLDKILNQIQNIWLDITKNNKVVLKKAVNKKFDFIKYDEKYLIEFYDRDGASCIKINERNEVWNDIPEGLLEIKLISSAVFWNECQNNSENKIEFYHEKFNS